VYEAGYTWLCSLNYRGEAKDAAGMAPLRARTAPAQTSVATIASSRLYALLGSSFVKTVDEQV
jgi:hypothetical protein